MDTFTECKYWFKITLLYSTTFIYHYLHFAINEVLFRVAERERERERERGGGGAVCGNILLNVECVSA